MNKTDRIKNKLITTFIYGYLAEGSYEKAFYYGVCTGSASAFSENLATKQEILHYMDLLQN